jgi:hypothetical protein
VSGPGWIVLAFLGWLTSQTRLTVHAAGGQASIPVLALAAVAVVLILAAVVLLILRSAGGMHLRPRMVTR